MKKSKSDYSIQTVKNALNVLEAFADEDELGVTELARRMGLHKNNVFRLLATLEEGGYIEQCPPSGGRYRLGVRCLENGQAFLRGRSLGRHARPRLDELVEQTGESAHLTLLSGFEVVHMDGISSDRLVVTPPRVGKRLPLHCTAAGKVLLGCSPPPVREAYDQSVAAKGGLQRRSPRTIVDFAKLMEHLSSVAVKGWAVDLEECEQGLCCAAAPVFQATGELAAALSVSAPAFRLSEEQLLRQTVPLVVAAAERLSRELGYAS